MKIIELKQTLCRANKITMSSFNFPLLLLSIFFCLNMSSVYPQKKNSQNPLFSDFSYIGEDIVYKENPLKSDEFYNPILQGCYPDPSITRKGDDYYLVCSSFSMFPGVPIFHSKDLVNWKQIRHVLDRKLQLKVENEGVSFGIYTTVIRCNQ